MSTFWHQAKRFVFAIRVSGVKYKIFQLIFGNDGSLYVDFPYYRESVGIVSKVTLPANMPPNSDVSLEPGGKVTSHLVKYSHHSNGWASFSKTGRVKALISNQSVPLGHAAGHIFTTMIQGVENFMRVRSSDNLPPSVSKTVLDFDFKNERQPAYKFVGWCYPISVMDSRFVDGSGGRAVLRTEDGKSRWAFIIGPPKGNPLDSALTLVSIEGIDVIDKHNETTMTFIGGFDGVVTDKSQESSFLAFIYPLRNVKEMLTRLGTIDLKSNAEEDPFA